MAKLQVYTSSDVINKISAIVNQRRSEGAKETEASLSSVSTMLLELGLRVFEAQMERKEDEFDQDV
ncbi:relaxosome protein TraM, partial [Sodalis endosymbiont of Spalangia cameroni]|uniref:relaxosome protein TraM n=1 Tax=Sodalis praecaptivus TaxID=1239307 RepID=UPI0031F9F5DE